MWRAIVLSVIAVFLFIHVAQAACPGTALANGTPADATQVMNLLDCKAPLASPSLSGTVTVSGVIESATTGVSNAMVLRSPDANFAELIINGGSQSDVGSSIYFQHQVATSAIIGERATIVGGTSRNFLIQSQGSNTVQVMAGSSGGVELASGATSWSAISDERLKRWSNSQPNYRAAIQDLWIGNYQLYSDFTKTGPFAERFGLRAQQAYAVLPASLRDMVVHKGNRENPWTVSSEPLAFLALWGVKDLYSQYDERQSRAAAKIVSMGHKIDQLQSQLRTQTAQLAELNATVHRLETATRLKTASR